MYPERASRRSTIWRSMLSNDSTVISRSWLFRISMKRDICVPLKWWGRCTYMPKVAMVCWVPLLLSRTLTGWRMALMPTLSMAIRRTSGVCWTSGMAVSTDRADIRSGRVEGQGRTVSQTLSQEVMGFLGLVRSRQQGRDEFQYILSGCAVGNDSHELALGVDEEDVHGVIDGIAGACRHIAEVCAILACHFVQLLLTAGQRQDALVKKAHVGLQDIGGIPFRVDTDKDRLNQGTLVGRQHGQQLLELQQFCRAHVRAISEAEIQQHGLALERGKRDLLVLRSTQREIPAQGMGPTPCDGRAEQEEGHDAIAHRFHISSLPINTRDKSCSKNRAMWSDVSWIR